jgi:hypothetical protein
MSCKKKYKSILDKYKNDKRLDEVSGNGRHEHNKDGLTNSICGMVQ